MTATDYIPIDTTLRGGPRLEPRSRGGLVLDRKARGGLLDRRGGQGDEGRFLKEAAATALGNAALGVAAGAAAPLFRDAARTAVNLSGAGPRVVLPVGPNGMRGIRRAGLSTPELEATRARLPGETADMWFANPRLSAAGRAVTRTGDSAVDQLAARFAERRNGALSARGMLAEPEAMSAAYPRGMAETTVRTRPAAGRRYGHSRVPATAESGAEITLYDVPGRAGYGRGDFAHEFLHTLSRREPFAVSRGYEFDPAVVSKARAAGSLGPETPGRFAYSTRVDENSARLLEAMNEVETTTMKGLDASGRTRVGREPGGVPAARSAGRPSDYPVATGYDRAYQQDSKGGDINDGRHGNFRNFLATDEVPETIFGIPVVQDESGYTGKDVEFFRENPKAAGFYEMGDEDRDGGAEPPDNGGGSPTAAGSGGPVHAADKAGPSEDIESDEEFFGGKKMAGESVPWIGQSRKLAHEDSKGGNTRSGTGAGETMKGFEPYVKRDSSGVLSSVFGVPVRRSLYPGEDTFFKGHRDTAGMAAEDGAIVLNPYSTNPSESQELVAVTEAARHHMKKMGDAVPAFTLTPGQREFFSKADNGRPYGSDEDIRHTILSRIIVGDKSAGDVTKAQRKAAEAVYRHMRDNTPVVKPRGKYPGASNNPGNVEKHEIRTDKTLFEGEDGGGKRPKRFARFTDPVLGLKASAVVLARKANALAKAGKPFTIANYAPFYAPPGENDTKAYIRNLSAYSGIARDAEIDRWDTKGLARLLRAKVRFETGPEASNWFTDAEYEEAAEKLQEGAFD